MYIHVPHEVTDIFLVLLTLNCAYFVSEYVMLINSEKLMYFIATGQEILFHNFIIPNIIL